MVSAPEKPQPVIIIVGPTASGKSAVAMRLANDYPVEIICADSRTVYDGPELGTAKPSSRDRQAVPHWGLDLVRPGERFTVHDFVVYATDMISKIQARGNIAVIAGGSGLYIDSLAYGYELRSGYDPEYRRQLENMGREELMAIIEDKGYDMPHSGLSTRHLMRIVETKGQSPTSKKPLPGAVLFGIWPTDEILKEAIRSRIEHIYAAGFGGEVASLIMRYGKEVTSACGIGYSSYISYLEGSMTLKQAKQEFAAGDWQYARRQRTWFKRNKDIEWYADSSECYNNIIQFMHKYYSN